MRRAAFILLAALLAAGCAEADNEDRQTRKVVEYSAMFAQELVVPSSILQFQVLNTSNRESTGALVSFSGDIGGGVLFKDEYYVPVSRLEEGGDLVVRVRVFDGLWQNLGPDPTIDFTGNIRIELDDQIGTFGRSYINGVDLKFQSEFPPEMTTVPTNLDAYVNELVPIEGSGFLRPEEGTTWAVVESGSMTYEDGSSRPVNNARIPVDFDTRTTGFLPISPAVFGVRLGEFDGRIRFESELNTGETFEGTTHDFAVTLKQTRIETLTPDGGSRGQKISVFGRGFVPTDSNLEVGMYMLFEGTFDFDDPELPTQTFQGASAFVKVPFRVVSESTIEQDVWYEITENGSLTGLGAAPGRFSGSITPVLFDAQTEQVGESWTGTFRVLPTKQIVYLRYLPGFSKALTQYGLQNVEQEVRDRVHYVLSRDYTGTHVEFRDSPPGDFIDYTTIEIGGPDPSGLLNFGYDNSFNDGGKDIGNLYLADYLGGVNRHSQTAGYLPYGGVFIESFIAFSPTLFPDNFGTSESFDAYLGPFMPALGGRPVEPDELEGSRAAAVRTAIELIGNLTGHTASHEIGHSLGLAHFPESVAGFDERFHNDPPGDSLIMDAGSDRPFEERAELDGFGPAKFSDKNMRYLQRVLPLP